jgi:hypothetical protein
LVLQAQDAVLINGAVKVILYLTLSHSAYFPSTLPETIRKIRLNLKVSLQKFTKNTILVKDA